MADSASIGRPLLHPSSDDDCDYDDNRSAASSSDGGPANSTASPGRFYEDVERPIGQSTPSHDEAYTTNTEDESSIGGNLTKELLPGSDRPDSVPIDRFGFNYLVFYLLGMTTLLPWNFFITADDYWMYKFRDVDNSTAVGQLTPIQAGFTSDLSVAAAVPSTVFLVLNAFIGHRIPLPLRMLGSMGVIQAFFLFTVALVVVDTDAWQALFFDLTLATVVIMNVASAILSGGLFGISGQFPSEYVTAVVSGQALGGIFAALAEIASLAFGASPTTSALVYFIIGNLVMCAAIVSYAIASRTAFFRYYTVDRLRRLKAASASIASSQSTRSLSTASGVTSSSVAIVGGGEPQLSAVLRKIWLYGLSEWLVFVVTLSVYPAVTVLVRSQGHGSGHPWNDVYFIPVVNYLVFNTGDYLGRILAGMIEWPRNRPGLIALIATLRIGFVPALIVCNATPRHTFPTIINDDLVFISLMAVFSFSNGYLANIALIGAPHSVASREREMASSMMAAFLGVGLAFGSTISLIVVQNI